MPTGLSRFRVRCRADSRLAVGMRRGTGNWNVALDFIPGTAFRGAAARLLLSRPEAEQDWAIFPRLDTRRLRAGASLGEIVQVRQRLL